MARATAKAKKSTTRKVTKRKTAAKKPAKRTTAKKTTARKTTVRKTTAKRAAPKKAAPKKALSSFKTPATKTQLMTTISEHTDVAKKDVAAVFECLADIINGHVKPRAAGEFTLPGLLKVKVVRKPATKARKGINPFNGEETIFKAKPARNVVKIKPLKKLKDMAEK